MDKKAQALYDTLEDAGLILRTVQLILAFTILGIAVCQLILVKGKR